MKRRKKFSDEEDGKPRLTIEQKKQECIETGKKYIPLPPPRLISSGEAAWLEKVNYIKPIGNAVGDHQKMRIQVGNRLCAIFYERMGIDPGKKITEETLMDFGFDEEASKKKIKMLDILRKEDKKITKAITGSSRKELTDELVVRESKLIHNTAELQMIRNYLGLVDQEEMLLKEVESRLPIFGPHYEWLDNIFGVGPVLSSALLTRLNPYRAPHVSSYWSFLGWGSIVDGKGGRAARVVVREYITKDNKLEWKDSTQHDPWLLSKVFAVIRQNFVRIQSPYRKPYEDYRHRLEQRPDLVEDYPNQKIRNAKIWMMSLRYGGKIFIRDLWVVNRTHEGLVVTPPYAEAKLGFVHSKQ